MYFLVAGMASHAFLEGLALSRLESHSEVALLALGNLCHELLCVLALGLTVASATLIAGGRAIGLCRGLALIYLVALMPLFGFLTGALLAALSKTFALAFFSKWFAAHTSTSAAAAVTVAFKATTIAPTAAAAATATATSLHLNVTAAALHSAAKVTLRSAAAAVTVTASALPAAGHVSSPAHWIAGVVVVDPSAAVGALLTALVLSFAAGTYLHISFLDLLARQTATSAGLFGTSGQQVGNRLAKVALCFAGFFFVALLRFIFPHVHS